MCIYTLMEYRLTLCLPSVRYATDPEVLERQRIFAAKRTAVYYDTYWQVSLSIVHCPALFL